MSAFGTLSPFAALRQSVRLQHYFCRGRVTGSMHADDPLSGLRPLRQIVLQLFDTVSAENGYYQPRVARRGKERPVHRWS